MERRGDARCGVNKRAVEQAAGGVRAIARAEGKKNKSTHSVGIDGGVGTVERISHAIALYPFLVVYYYQADILKPRKSANRLRHSLSFLYTCGCEMCLSADTLIVALSMFPR